jgi:glycosyltransferase involved in cell wall biosynthesis
MLTVIIPTHNSERTLVPTLAMLVPGAMSGTVRDVIVADAGSTDGTAGVVDVAGCEIMVSGAPLAARLKSAVAAARGGWLLFLRPGVVLEPSWVGEAERTIEQAVLGGTTGSHAAVFRRSADTDVTLPRQVIALLAATWRGPHPEQGLMISREAYDRLGGHREGVADPESELLRRIGRRRIATLRSAATGWRW